MDTVRWLAGDWGLDGALLDDAGPSSPEDDPPPNRLDPTAFQVEVLDSRGTTVANGNGPLEVEVPTPVRIGPGVPAAANVLATPWRVRITNGTVFDANVVVHVQFHGTRPIVEKPYHLDFINDRLEALFNGPQPLALRFENRRPPERPYGSTTWFVVDAAGGWKVAHPELDGMAFDIGARVLSEVTGTAGGGITVKACVVDGSPAIRMSIAFDRDRGRIDVIEVLRLVNAGLATTANFIVDATPADPPMLDIEAFAVDVYFVLRPHPVTGLPTFQVIAQPVVDIGGDMVSVALRILTQAVFEIALPQALGAELQDYAGSLAAWVLGDRDRVLVGGDETLDIQYVGDRPSPQVLAPTAVSPTTVPMDPGNLRKVDHIVVVMMENRSFDHMLGYLSLPTAGNGDLIGRGRTAVSGLTGNETNPSGVLGIARTRVFPLSRPWAGPEVPPELRTRPTQFFPDPGHGYEDTAAQRGDYTYRPRPFGPSVRIGKNEGFVLNFADRLSRRTGDAAVTRALAGEVMGYHPAEHVPTYDFLASAYGICDNWFAAHPGHTWPNRFVGLTGRLATGPGGLPQVDNPSSDTYDPLETPTIVDHLLRAGVTCKYFEHDFCMLRVFSKYTFDDNVIQPANDPARGFFALARAGRLPSVTFLEPDLTGIDVGNDDHPPADVSNGQAFIRRVYDALSQGPQQHWERTLLLITYDEHGGFYDHVHPEDQPVIDMDNPLRPGFVPLALDPDTLMPVTHYGMRVPALVVSPHVPPGEVSHQTYDHTSILKTIIARFLLNNPPDMGWRVAHAAHVGPLLSRARPRPTVAVPHPPPLETVKRLLRPPTPTGLAGPEDQDFRDFLRGFKERVRT